MLLCAHIVGGESNPNGPEREAGMSGGHSGSDGVKAAAESGRRPADRSLPACVSRQRIGRRIAAERRAGGLSLQRYA